MPTRQPSKHDFHLAEVALVGETWVRLDLAVRYVARLRPPCHIDSVFSRGRLRASDDRRAAHRTSVKYEDASIWT